MTMNSDHSRRDFIKRAGALSLAGAAGPLAMNLAAIGEAAAATASDYKALVCVFLYGGNDWANTVVSYDTEYHKKYHDERPAIAITREELEAAGTVLNPYTPLPELRQYGLAPKLKPLIQHFDEGKLAVILNVGTLFEPTTKEDYLAGTNGTVKLPPKLFSHNDQQSFYQSSGAEGSTSGWGGRLGGEYAAGNGNSTFTCISVATSGVFLSNSKTVAYQVSTTGAVKINGISAPLYGSAACQAALRELITAPSSHLFESAHAAVVQTSIAAEGVLSPLLAGSPRSKYFPAEGVSTLADEMAMVARIIAKQSQLLQSTQTGPKRQVFFVGLGGFDTHDGILLDHPKLMEEVGTAMSAFYRETKDLGVSNQVTTFTASDFGRTLNSDGDGSDHGWGSMHFVLGGAVKGREFYGEAPLPANNGKNDVGRGRLLPRISVDQFAAQLGTWFGASADKLNEALPNLKNFKEDTLPLNFMQPPLPAAA
jgi:uncharacterized protein (DUF1501 family)